MKEQTRHRLGVIHRRFGEPRAPVASTDETFDQAFARVRDTVLRPVMEEFASELRPLGHAPRIDVDAIDHEGVMLAPAITLRLGLKTAPERLNVIAFAVIRWRVGDKQDDSPEVLAFQQKDIIAFDLYRYMRPDELARDVVEKLILDAAEGLFAQNAR